MNIFNYLLNHQGILILLLVWSMPWKGVALWRSAKNNQLGWFTIIFILNTAAILDIIYLFTFSRKSEQRDSFITQ